MVIRHHGGIGARRRTRIKKNPPRKGARIETGTELHLRMALSRIHVEDALLITIFLEGFREGCKNEAAPRIVCIGQELQPQLAGRSGQDTTFVIDVSIVGSRSLKVLTEFLDVISPSRNGSRD
ncbi:hypothetical protein KM043_005829 [Ampulex compressa]|nr:hypothetical protein KM043_005829 [Ampulex compressa]